MANVAAYPPERTSGAIQLKRKSLRNRVAEKLGRNAKLSPREQRVADQLVGRTTEKLARGNTSNTSANLTPREVPLAPSVAFSPGAGFQTALTNEIQRRNTRRSNQGHEIAAEIRAGARPDKPPALSQKHNKADLTAHHLVPYNQIRESFASAVEGQDLTAMQNILSFSGKASSDSSEAFRALAYQQPYTPKTNKAELSAEEKERRKQQALSERAAGIAPFQKTLPPTSSKQGIKDLFKATTWASHNVFMGPAPEHRLDDPKEGLDARYTRQGQLTKSSVMARDIHKKGFSGIDPVDFSLSVQSARNEAEGRAPLVKSGLDAARDKEFGPRQGGLRKFDPADWKTVGDKSAQVGKELRAHDRRYQKWAGKNNWQKLHQLGYINKEEAEQMRASVAEKRRKKRAEYQAR